MKEKTMEIYRSILDAPLFENCGDRDVNKSTIEVASWEEAQDQILSPSSETIRLKKSNDLSRAVTKVSPTRMNDWNKIMMEAKSLSQNLLENRIQGLISENKLSQWFLFAVSWDISHILTEFEYSDIISPDIFLGELKYYLDGHFPCGWTMIDGVYRRMIY
jgi:hypothetical protein